MKLLLATLALALPIGLLPATPPQSSHPPRKDPKSPLIVPDDIETLRTLVKSKEAPEFVIWVQTPNLIQRGLLPAESVPTEALLEYAVWSDGLVVHALKWDDPGAKIVVGRIPLADVQRVRTEFASSKLAAGMDYQEPYSLREMRVIAMRDSKGKPRLWRWAEDFNPGWAPNVDLKPEWKAFVSSWYIARLAIATSSRAGRAHPIEDVVGPHGAVRGYTVEKPTTTPWLASDFWWSK